MNRVRLTRPAAERLLARAGVRPPWRCAPLLPPTRTASRLGGAAVGTGEEPEVELVRLGALTADGVHPDLVPVLEVLDRPRVLLEIDLAARRPGGDARFHSWQRLLDDRVVALSTTGEELELSWHRREEWSSELARVPAALPHVQACRDRAVTVPQQLLVATGAALRAGRGDLADALVLENRLDAPLVRRLHDCRARLRVVVTGARPGTGTGPGSVRWLGWVLLADGWRELDATPDGVGVRLTPITPPLLGARVERLVNGALA